MSNLVSVHTDVNQSRAQRRLVAMSERAENFSMVLRFAREELRRANAENFATGGLPVGGWAPLDAEYGAWKASHGAGTEMRRTGKLFNSLVGWSSINRIGLTEAEFGTSVEYAKFHQYGTRHMPARRIVFEPAGFAEVLGRASAHHVAEGGSIPFLFEGGD